MSECCSQSPKKNPLVIATAIVGFVLGIFLFYLASTEFNAAESLKDQDKVLAIVDGVLQILLAISFIGCGVLALVLKCEKICSKKWLSFAGIAYGVYLIVTEIIILSTTNSIAASVVFNLVVLMMVSIAAIVLIILSLFLNKSLRVVGLSLFVGLAFYNLVPGLFTGASSVASAILGLVVLAYFVLLLIASLVHPNHEPQCECGCQDDGAHCECGCQDDEPKCGCCQNDSNDK